MAATASPSSSPFQTSTFRTPTGPSQSSPELPKVPSKKTVDGRRGTQPPLLNTPITVSFLRDRERLMIAINTVLFLTATVCLFKQALIGDYVKSRAGLGIPCLRHCASLVIGLSVVNILFTFLTASLRFLKRSFGNGDTNGGQSPNRLNVQRSLLRDTTPTAIKQSPLRSVTNLEYSHTQTPLRSPFAKQSVSGSGTLSGQSAVHLPPSTSASSTTPKALFTPSARSINLRTPSALLTSPSSPFSVRTPAEAKGKPVGSLMDTSSTKPTTPASASLLPASSPQPTPSKSPKKEINRRVFRGDECLRMLSLQRDFEERIEATRSWLWSMVIRPLVEDIDRVEAAFQANGMSHLGPLCPASMTLLNSCSPSTNSHFDLRPAFFSSPGTLAASSRPQTLMDLAQQARHDPMVQARLRIEKYLDVATGAGQVAAGPRVALIRRLRTIAASPYVPPDATADDALLFMHLFCTFLDERLPSSDLYAAQPFSARYFVSVMDGSDPGKHGLHGLPVAIAQTNRSPPVFAVLTPEECFIPVASNPVNGCLHALVFFSTIVEKRLAGHLGIANLRSRSIRLLAD